MDHVENRLRCTALKVLWLLIKRKALLPAKHGEDGRGIDARIATASCPPSTKSSMLMRSCKLGTYEQLKRAGTLIESTGTSALIEKHECLASLVLWFDKV